MNSIVQCKNVIRIGTVFVEDVGRFQAFSLREPSIQEWNARAQKANTKAFIEAFGRQPVDYDEVLAWAYSIGQEKEKNHHVGSAAV